MAIAVGVPVARRVTTTIHVANQVSGYVVMSRCGNTLIAPQCHGLKGVLCLLCQAPKR